MGKSNSEELTYRHKTKERHRQAIQAYRLALASPYNLNSKELLKAVYPELATVFSQIDKSTILTTEETQP